MTVCVMVCVRAPVRLYALQAAFLVCHVSSSIVLRCLRYNERPAAAACIALAAASSPLPPISSSSITPSLSHSLPLSLPPSPTSAPSCVILNGAVHSGYCSASPGRVS